MQSTRHDQKFEMAPALRISHIEKDGGFPNSVE